MTPSASASASHSAQSTGSQWHIHVRPKRPSMDGHGRAVLADIRQIGLAHIAAVHSSRLYLLEGALSEAHIRTLASELFSDPVVEAATFAGGFSERQDEHPTIEVHPLPGVMDPVALSALDAARALLSARFGPAAADIRMVGTARRYEIVGAGDVTDLQTIASRVLANDCIETWYLTGFGRADAIPDAFPTPPVTPFTGPRPVGIRGLNDDALMQLSRKGHLFLSLEEMRAIREHFIALNREPTDLELETLAQTWSEHCVHKTLKSAFEYRGEDFGRPGKIETRFGNLLKDTIAAATNKLNRDWCLSVFVDNAGVIAFDEEYGVAFKVETHNHPSAIEPYGGAATGVGGCIRDVMGCGLGAKPIASTDVFCLAPPDFADQKVPSGVLHPRRVLKGVVRGVRDYGNRMGIPTVNGAIYFDDRYLANPLVFCGCVGLIPRKHIRKGARPGDLIVVAGGRTGRDGIHGATFSSAELTDKHADEFSHAVQIGNAIVEKKLLDALLIARDHAERCLYSAVTDCGAGGLSSAVGEMGAALGAIVDLEKVPLKYSGLRYDEIWISEAQERMVFAVPPEKIDRFLRVFADEDVEATVIGTFTDDKSLRVRFRNTVVGELDMHFLHEGLPKQTLTARWDPPAKPAASPPPPAGRASSSDSISNETLLRHLRSLNVASKEWVIRQYDHEVQGRSVIKPLTGPGAGPADAAVLRPRYDRPGGVAIGCGLCPWLADVDPYWMAIAAVDEALRNVICVGADPDRTAILDNFCWPKVDSEQSRGALVRACRGAHDAAMAYGLPFISGKDSLNNEFSMSPEESRRTGLPPRMAIPYTLLISALGIVPDVRRSPSSPSRPGCVTMDFKSTQSALVLATAPVDRRGLAAANRLHREVSAMVRGESPLPDGVRAIHDVSDGGLGATLAEMCIASGIGAEIRLNPKSWPHSLFDPVPTTYVLELSLGDAHKWNSFPTIGITNSSGRLTVKDDDVLVDLTVQQLAAAWRQPLSLDQGGPT